MTTTYKSLGQIVPAAATATTLYTVGASTQTLCSRLDICNQGVTTTVRVAVRPAGATLDPKHYQIYDVILNANDTMPYPASWTLATTDVVTVYSLSGTVSFSLWGAELT